MYRDATLEPAFETITRIQTVSRHKEDLEDELAVTFAKGDGIGPEISDAVQNILQQSGVNIKFENVTLGLAAYERGIQSGIPEEAWESLDRTGLMLKGPISTPQGDAAKGYKSVNVTLRKALGLFANVRPCVAYAPWVQTRHPKLDMIIVRENEEDLYAGIEHQPTEEVVQCLKLMSKPACDRIARYAFDLAQAAGRKKVSCFTKDNIMKLTDGLFHKSFNDASKQYPKISKEHLIVDIGAARLANKPEQFDVVLLPNLYGDILSDVAAEIAGSVGLSGSGNLGEHAAMFEAVHGSAPDIAGKDIANPSGLLTAALYMLAHAGRSQQAQRIYDAWLCTLQDGIHTADITGGHTTKIVGTKAFAQAVIDRLGEQPRQRRMLQWPAAKVPLYPLVRAQPQRKEFVGIDVFVQDRAEHVQALISKLGKITQARDPLELIMITNRGVKVWPNGHMQTGCVDHWRLRFLGKPQPSKQAWRDVNKVLGLVSQEGFEVVKTENLYTFDGKPGFSAAQGQ
jgi:isocitrate dehydrogenase